MRQHRRRQNEFWCLLLTTITTTITTVSPLVIFGLNSRTFSSSSMKTNALMSADLSEGAENMFVVTPLVYSEPLSSLVEKPIYLKLDALQASGSFKDRGMSHLCTTLQKEGTTELISSSGGNAGLSVSMIGLKLGLKVSVIVPETTKPLIIAKLKSLGANVTVHGKNWNEADTLARERVDANPDQASYVSPYDNQRLWTGHSTIVDEISDQLLSLSGDDDDDDGSRKYASLGAIVVSVGGGGLLCGVLEGLARRKLRTKVITSETNGASCFMQAYEAGGDPIILPGIDSIATSLGATSCTPVALDRARSHEGGFAASACTDEEAVDACVRFARDHRLLVEPACGAALAVAYSKRLRDLYLKNVDGPIVLEVCGGSGVDVDLLHSWKMEYLP
mmetsp:Transcript_16711/g.18407  ORF Transcript_16711/g.18407 Transcript_16711/m.18407 type:complete len:391 (+) Transcript_16711:33-1205(+)